MKLVLSNDTLHPVIAPERATCPAQGQCTCLPGYHGPGCTETDASPSPRPEPSTNGESAIKQNTGKHSLIIILREHGVPIRTEDFRNYAQNVLQAGNAHDLPYSDPKIIIMLGM